MRKKSDDELLARQSDAPGEQPESEAYRKVLDALGELRPDDLDVALKLKDTAIRVLGDRTLEEAIRDGDSDMALRYLQSISGGQNG